MTHPTTYLGVSSPVSALGQELRDGSAVACRTGETPRTAAATEERLTGRRYDPNIAAATARVLAAVGHRPGDRLVVGISSALGPRLDRASAASVLQTMAGVRADEVRVVGHHRSHALAAFAPSGFDRAVVLVNDSMGDVMTSGRNRVVECQSVFVASRASDGAISLDLVSRDFPDGQGYGQLYRAVTRYLGFPGYHHAAKVMAIAGCAPAQASPLPPPHEWGPDGLGFRVRIDPDHPAASLDQWLARHLPRRLHAGPRDAALYDPEHFREHGTASLRPHDLMVAAWVQEGLQDFLAERVRRAVADSGVHKVCLGGGTSLNCVANALVRALPEVDAVHVSCAPGDSGQALGNVISLLTDDASQAIASLREPYLTTPGPLTAPCPSSRESAARVLADGGVVAVGRGEPEYGPRALGHRSLLARPTPDNVLRLRATKQREDYQPFAAVVTEAYADEHLGGLRSPFMSFAPRVSGAADDLRAVMHVDGTCRVQTLARAQDPWLHEVLTDLSGRGLPPILINTSLNLRGAAMCHDLPSAANLVATYAADLAVVEPGPCDPSDPTCTALEAHDAHR